MIVGINGSPIEDLGQILEMFEGIEDIEKLEIDVDRNGKKVPFNYQVN